MVSRSNKKRQLPSSAPRRYKGHRLAWCIVFIVLIAAATFVLINLFQPLHPDQPAPSDNTTSETTNSTTVKGSTQSEKEDTSKEDTEPLIKEKTPAKHEGSSANSSASLTGSISYTDISNGRLSVRVNIDQFLESGACTLHLTRGEHDYYFEAPITLSASTSTCRGFDVDTADIPFGDYDLRIDLTSGDKTGAINGKVTL